MTGSGAAINCQLSEMFRFAEQLPHFVRCERTNKRPKFRSCFCESSFARFARKALAKLRFQSRRSVVEAIARGTRKQEAARSISTDALGTSVISIRRVSPRNII